MSTEQVMTVHQMETPSSTQGAFDLPCGWVNPETKELYTEAEVREITGNEEDMLASDKVPGDSKMDLLLANCVTRIGPVTDKGQISQIVQDMMVGDRVFLIFAIRRVTLGNEMPMREACPSCKKKNLFIIDLSELDTQEMPSPLKRVYDFTLPSGKKVRYRASTGRDEKKLSKINRKNRGDALSQMILMRLELVDGEQPTLEIVKSMGMKDRHALRHAFNNTEGGVDTSLEMECPACSHEWQLELSLAARDFFFPSEMPNP